MWAPNTAYFSLESEVVRNIENRTVHIHPRMGRYKGGFAGDAMTDIWADEMIRFSERGTWTVIIGYPERDSDEFVHTFEITVN